MLPVRVRFSGILIVVFFIFCSGNLKSQNEGYYGYNNEFYDTSSYIPPFFIGALDYNLMIASSNGYLKEIIRLVTKGAEVDATSEKGITPLLFAVYNNQVRSVKMLVGYEADVNKRNAELETPLIVAAQYGYSDIAEVLIRAGANVGLTDKFDCTALHYASIYGFLQTVDLLLYYDAFINAKSNEGTTPLLAAVWAGRTDVADLLIQNGAAIEDSDNEGVTPFLMAALNGDTLIMDMLLKKGAQLYETNNAGYNALALSIAGGHAEATEYLLRRGNLWVKSEDKTMDPFVVAKAYRRKETITLLTKYKIPGNPSNSIDQISFGLSSRLVQNDIFSGLSMTYKTSADRFGIITGIDTKIWNTRVLIKDAGNNYTQYWEKSSLVYCGILKDITVGATYRSSTFLSPGLNVGYLFVTELRGTTMRPESKFKIIPAFSIKQVWDYFSISFGLEYCRSYYQISPVWMRVGFNWNYTFEDVKLKRKTIKWY